MPVHPVVRQITGEGAGQVLAPIGAIARDGPRITAVRSGLPGALAAVVSHGLVKEQVVPSKEIDYAVERKKRFEANPAKHTYEET